MSCLYLALCGRPPSPRHAACVARPTLHPLGGAGSLATPGALSDNRAVQVSLAFFLNLMNVEQIRGLKQASGRVGTKSYAAQGAPQEALVRALALERLAQQRRHAVLCTPPIYERLASSLSATAQRVTHVPDIPAAASCLSAASRIINSASSASEGCSRRLRARSCASLAIAAPV